jgi:hypothetical protein
MKNYEKKSDNYYTKYLKYKSKYLELKNLNNKKKLIGGVNIKFIIISHGFYDPELCRANHKPYEFTIPHGLTLHTFVPIGKILYCTNKTPKKVCDGIEKPLQSFVGGTNFPNYVIKSDEANSRKIFHSGVKRCDTNEIIFNIDDLFRGGMTYLFLNDIINYIIEYCKTNIKGITHAEIYLLFCLEGITEDYSRDILSDMFSDMKM